MEQYKNQNILQKHFNFYLKKFKLALQTSKEYKSNLYSHIFSDIIITISYMIFFKVTHNLIGEHLNWTYFDFWLYFLLIGISAKSMYSFTLRKFSNVLLKGDFNTIQTKPINRFIYSITNNTTGHGIITTINFIIAFIISIFYNLEIYNIINTIFSIIFLILVNIYFYAFFNFFESFAFFIKYSEKNNKTCK